MDETHDPARRSWVDSANTPDTDFPIQNLPFGLFRRLTPGEGSVVRLGAAIGDQILDVSACREAGLLAEVAGAPVERDEATLDAMKPGRTAARSSPAATAPATPLNALMAAGREYATALRRRLCNLLDEKASTGEERWRVSRLLVPQDGAAMLLPHIGDYTDFYASIDHAANVGRLFRPDNPLLPNYKWVPIAYHGRASSIVASGTPVRRPRGQVRSPNSDGAPRVAVTERLDYELEVGCFIGPGNDLGTPISIDEAEGRMFGLCLVNDWSARDIQQWEYQPLGPFLGKNFATTVSPWVVTLDALEPFRRPAPARPASDPAPLPYLDCTSNRERGAVALTLEVGIRTAAMREGRRDQVAWLTRGDFSRTYWTFAQMLAHHASNGCNLRPGDLLASGTVSGPAPTERGCLLELTRGGAEPITLPNGERRAFLEDGDEVTIRGFCEQPGCARIGFGPCRGVILPAAL